MQLLTTAADLPDAPVMALAGVWDLSRGEHPHLAGPLADILPKLPLFPSVEEWLDIAALGLPLGLAHKGHHVLRDGGPRHAANPALQDEWPLAPVFVRDLCGRVIHTGLLPLPVPQQQPLFPAGCADVPATMGGAAHLEHAVFAHVTLLEVAPARGTAAAGEAGYQWRAAYGSPAAYPYKIRPETFYADGWRLPQVARVFARAASGADAVAAAFMQAWEARPDGQDYEAFYEAQGGAPWFETLFLQGVTVIPTFEGYNGAFQVAHDFTLQGVEPGRAVAGLHAVIGQEAASLPAGTIVAVKAPGFATARSVVPAQVVVSSGPSLTPTDAPLPNLMMPHPHVGPVWGACWLPTRPQHFAAPALWDWLNDGTFAQVSGPLWCPRHYVYGSTGALVRALCRPKADNALLGSLPEKLKHSFFPATACQSYDTLNERTMTERERQPAHALHGSALDILPLGRDIVPMGYHPVPQGWGRIGPAQAAAPAPALGGCPADMAGRLAAAVKPSAAEQAALARHHVAVSEPMRATLEACTELNAAEGAPSPSAWPDWLPALPPSQLNVNVKRLFANRHYRAALTLTHGALPAALYRFKEAALAWRRLRYRLVTKYPAALQEAVTKGLDMASAEGLAGVMPAAAHESAAAQRRQHITLVPARLAAALHAVPKPIKLPAMAKPVSSRTPEGIQAATPARPDAAKAPLSPTKAAQNGTR